MEQHHGFLEGVPSGWLGVVGQREAEVAIQRLQQLSSDTEN
jgi:hypothetical protein